jgi:hypothetical protein
VKTLASDAVSLVHEIERRDLLLGFVEDTGWRGISRARIGIRADSDDPHQIRSILL